MANAATTQGINKSMDTSPTLSRAAHTRGNKALGLQRKLENSYTFSDPLPTESTTTKVLTEAELLSVMSGFGTRDPRLIANYETNPELFPVRSRGLVTPGYYARMLSNPIIASGVALVKDSVVSLDWEPSAPVGASAAEHAKTEIIEDMFRDIDGGLSELLRAIFDNVVYGFTMFEIVWHVTDDLIKLPKRFKFVAPWTIKSWVVNVAEGELLGVMQQTRDKGLVFIPIEKLAYFPRNFNGENFEGDSALRSLYFTDKAYQQLFIAYQIAMERAGEGTLWAESKITGADQMALIEEQQVDDLEAACDRFFAGESSYVIPHPLWKLDFRQAFPQAPTGYLDALAHTMSRTLSDVVKDFGSKTAQGSYAAAETISGETQKQLTGICKGVATRIEQQIINKVFKVNGWKERPTTMSVSGFRDDIWVARVIQAAQSNLVTLTPEQWNKILGI
jgi:hypothetical protein